MAIRKVKGVESGFSILPNHTVNASLSWSAKGMLAYLLSKPDDWSVSVAQLVKHSSESARPTKRDGTYAIINELIDAGYIQRVRTSGGGYSKTEYIVSSSPDFKPLTENPLTVEPTQQSKDKYKEKTITNNVESVRRTCDEPFTENPSTVERPNRCFAGQLDDDHQHCKTAMQILQELKADYPQIYDGSQAIEQWDLCELTLEWLTHSEYADSYASFNAMLRVLLESLLQLRFSASNDDSVGLPKLLCVNAEDGTLENIIEHEQILEV